MYNYNMSLIIKENSQSVIFTNLINYLDMYNELYVILNGLPNNSEIRQMYLYNVNKDKITHLYNKDR